MQGILYIIIIYYYVIFKYYYILLYYYVCMAGSYAFYYQYCTNNLLVLTVTLCPCACSGGYGSMGNPMTAGTAGYGATQGGMYWNYRNNIKSFERQSNFTLNSIPRATPQQLLSRLCSTGTIGANSQSRFFLPGFLTTYACL